jgi:predicted MFS family arabinose efflux permease
MGFRECDSYLNEAERAIDAAQVFLMIFNHFAYGFNYFYPSIVEGFNLGTRTITLVCTAPPFIIAAAISFGLARHSDYRDERSLHIVGPMMVAIVGFIISVATFNQPARYFASFLFVGGCFASNGLIYSWAAGVLNDTPEKRAVAGAIINVLAQLGNIGSPYFFRTQDAPRYVLAMILLIVFAGLCACCCLFLKFDLRRANKKLRAAAEEDGTTPKLYTT